MDVRVTYGITAATFLVLLLVVFYIIPEYVAADQQDDATHWAMVSYSALLFLLTAIKTEFNAMNVSLVFLFTVIIAVQTSGIYWWIPKYIPKASQQQATHWMIIGSSMAILLASLVFTGVWKQGYESVNLISDVSLGGRRRR
jgi:hypothetical protein